MLACIAIRSAWLAKLRAMGREDALREDASERNADLTCKRVR